MYMKNKDWILVILLGLFWGSSFFFVEMLLKYLSPFMIVYLRVSIASIFLIVFIIIRGTKFKLSLKNLFNLFIMSLLNNIFPFLLITFGQQTTTGGLASILNANTSFIGILLASLFLPLERLNFYRLIGVSIGVLGVIIAIGYQNIIQLNDDDLGKYLILYFYPRDNTSGCTKEAKDFSNLKLEFDSLNTVVIGISSDTYESHNKFISKHDLKIELISDIDNNLCQYFGVWVEKNMYGKKFMGIERSTFLIDPSGIIIKEWRKVKVTSHAEELLNYLRKIKK